MANKKTPPKKATKPAAKVAPKAVAKSASKASTKAPAKAATKASTKVAAKGPAPRGKSPGDEVTLTKADLVELIRRLGEVASILKVAVEAFDGKSAVIRPEKEYVMFLKPIPGAARQTLINNC